MSNSFQERKIGLEIRDRYAGQEPIDLGNKLHIECVLDVQPMTSGSTLNAIVYGLNQNLMSRLSFIEGRLYGNRDDKRKYNPGFTSDWEVTVYIQESDFQKQYIFTGYIIKAFYNLSGGDSSFVIYARTMADWIFNTTQPFSKKGTMGTKALISSLLLNSGCNASFSKDFPQNDTVTDPYYSGNFNDKLQKIHEDFGYTYNYTKVNSGQSNVGVVKFYPRNYTGIDETPIEISPQKNLLEYPSYSQAGLNIKTILMPELTFNALLDFSPDSNIPDYQIPMKNNLNPQGQYIPVVNAKGYWTVIHVVHQFSSQIPNAPWYSYVECQLAPFGQGYARPR